MSELIPIPRSIERGLIEANMPRLEAAGSLGYACMERGNYNASIEKFVHLVNQKIAIQTKLCLAWSYAIHCPHIALFQVTIMRVLATHD